MAAASLPLEEFDEKFLTCAVCEEIYTDPRVLPCLHTFCAKCLEKWRKGESQFTCPTCRDQVRLRRTGVKGLPPYFFMNSLLDFRALHNSEEAHTKCQMCKSENKVEGRCADCSFLLCKNCITIHSNTPVLKAHYIITLNDLKNPSSRPKYTRAQYCPRHTDQRMTFYCKPCAKLVCRDCTITEHRPGPNHDPQEVSEVAQTYKAELQKLVEKTKHTDEVLKKTKETVGHELTSITTNCRTVREEIKEHFADMRKKLDEEEKNVTERLDKMEKDQKEPLLEEEKELEQNIASTEEGLKFSTDILARGNDVEILTLRQQLDDRLNALSSTQIQHEALKNKVSFQPDTTCTDLFECYLMLTDESLPGKHMVGVDTGGGEGNSVGRSLCFPQTVEVKYPVVRFGQKGSQFGQFNTPIDLAVSGDRLYVADTLNKRVQVFDLAGNFYDSFITSTNPASIAVETDGTIAVRCENEVKKFSPSGELLHKFPMSEHCTDPYGLAVQRGGRVVVADYAKHSIFLFEADGALVKQVGGQGEGEGQFNKPCFVCVDKEDNIIVSDKINHRIQVFDKGLTFQHKFGQNGREPQNMWCPHGVSADSRGNIVLGNIGEKSVVGGVDHGKKLQVFRPDSTWVSTISSDGDKLKKPHGVAVTEDGHVFVADTGDHCIRKYRYM